VLLGSSLLLVACPDAPNADGNPLRTELSQGRGEEASRVSEPIALVDFGCLSLGDLFVQNRAWGERVRDAWREAKATKVVGSQAWEAASLQLWSFHTKVADALRQKTGVLSAGECEAIAALHSLDGSAFPPGSVEYGHAHPTRRVRSTTRRARSSSGPAAHAWCSDVSDDDSTSLEPVRAAGGTRRRRSQPGASASRGRKTASIAMGTAAVGPGGAPASWAGTSSLAAAERPSARRGQPPTLAGATGAESAGCRRNAGTEARGRADDLRVGFEQVHRDARGDDDRDPEHDNDHDYDHDTDPEHDDDHDDDYEADDGDAVDMVSDTSDSGSDVGRPRRRTVVPGFGGKVQNAVAAASAAGAGASPLRRLAPSGQPSRHARSGETHATPIPLGSASTGSQPVESPPRRVSPAGALDARTVPSSAASAAKRPRKRGRGRQRMASEAPDAGAEASAAPLRKRGRSDRLSLGGSVPTLCGGGVEGDVAGRSDSDPQSPQSSQPWARCAEAARRGMTRRAAAQRATPQAPSLPPGPPGGPGDTATLGREPATGARGRRGSISRVALHPGAFEAALLRSAGVGSPPGHRLRMDEARASASAAAAMAEAGTSSVGGEAPRPPRPSLSSDTSLPFSADAEPAGHCGPALHGPPPAGAAAPVDPVNARPGVGLAGDNAPAGVTGQPARSLDGDRSQLRCGRLDQASGTAGPSARGGRSPANRWGPGRASEASGSAAPSASAEGHGGSFARRGSWSAAASGDDPRSHAGQRALPRASDSCPHQERLAGSANVPLELVEEDLGVDADLAVSRAQLRLATRAHHQLRLLLFPPEDAPDVDLAQLLRAALALQDEASRLTGCIGEVLARRFM